MATKRKLSAVAPEEDSVDPSDQLMFMGLGGCNEVGRSCHILQYKGKTIMLDAGMHPAYDGHAALPYFDEFDLASIDVLLISHFHIDHAAALPYVLSKTSFRGRVFMTHSTKAIYKWLIQDSVRVGSTASSSEQRTQLYTEHDHLSTFPQIEAIDYHTTHTVSGIRITPYPAGHVLGAAMFHLDIAGLSILFTGDYSREEDRHLIPATFPKHIKVDVLITESTYGVASHTPRKEREASLLRSITSIIDRGGRVLMPVFALGRAQELLLILDEYWAAHPQYQRVPIYYASNLARKCMIVYQTYIGAMNDNIKRRFRERMAETTASGSSGGSGGPWDFKFIRSLKSLEHFNDVGPSVMLASPGMMQNGVSRELLERWAPDSRNGVVITGYSVEGTMAKTIMNEPETIPAIMSKASAAAIARRGRENEAQKIPRRCSVAEYSFAAHVDGTENRDFIESVAAPVVVLVHGERHNMARLKSRLLSLNASKADKDKTKIHNPMNCDPVYIPIRKDKVARVVGRLAERYKPKAKGAADDDEEDQIIRNAVLVEKDFKLTLMDPEDLKEYAGLTTTTITCRQKITLASASLPLIRWALEGFFGGVEEVPTKSQHKTNTVQDRAGKATNGNTTAYGLPGTMTVAFKDDDPHSRAGKASNRNATGSGLPGTMTLAFKDDEEEDCAENPTNGNATGRRFSQGSNSRRGAEETNPRETKLRVMDVVTISYRGQGEMEIVWEGNLSNDSVADAVIAVLLSVESSPAAVKQSSKLHHHGPVTKAPNGRMVIPERPRNPHSNVTPEVHFQRLMMFLEAQFGADAITPLAPSDLPTPSPTPTPSNAVAQPGSETPDFPPGIPPALKITLNANEALVWLKDVKVECKHATTRARVKAVVERAMKTIAPTWRKE